MTVKAIPDQEARLETHDPSDKRKKQQTRSARTRDLLLHAAERVFIRDGFEKAALADIAKMAGKRRGAVYSHFKDKEDLFLSLLAARASLHGIRVRELLAELSMENEASSSLRESVGHVVDNFDSIILLMEFQLYAVRHPETQKILNGLTMPGGDPWKTIHENALSVGMPFLEETAAIFKVVAAPEGVRIGTRSEKLSWDKRPVETVVAGLLNDIFQFIFEGKPSAVEA